MHRRLQFDLRESPASDRRHGTRPEGNCFPNGICAENATSTSTEPVAVRARLSSDAHATANAASSAAATGGNTEGAAGGFVARPNNSQSRGPAFEPLIGSVEAARLLGNIHVKTLQRYARRGNVPGYQIGGHWYFRTSELDSWLQSRINSSCHPCRSK